ncbi:MAG TPA: hypothetical protein VKN18_15430 [Blastocatellia bacterium]|nr:hypothetical protein [Blastocatellia bacterium]
MSAEEVLAFFPENSFSRNAIESAQDEPNFGIARLVFYVSSLPSQAARERFAGIELINLVLFDGHLVELNLNYTGANSRPKRGPIWRNVDEFVNRLSEVPGLPPATVWFDRDGSSKTLRCTGFIVTALVEQGSAGTITLRIPTSYEETVRQRALAEQERKRREFKP